MAHRVTRVDQAALTGDCEECGPGVPVRERRRQPPRTTEWRCKKATRRAPGAKALQQRRAQVRQYGITPEDRDRMVAEQEGRCAICRRERLLVIDHCHREGHVRGLLCGQCNTAIGLFGDDPEVIRLAADYLSR